MTHLNEGLYAHHRGRGNTRATMDLLVEAIRKLSDDVQAIKKSLGVSTPVAPAPKMPVAAAKITSEEVISVLKTKVEDVVAEVEKVSEEVDSDLVSKVEEVEAELKALIEGTMSEIDDVVKPTTAPTTKKKTK